MNLKTEFAVKCDTLEQKQHVISVLVKMGYKEDKEWNDEHIGFNQSNIIHVSNECVIRIFSVLVYRNISYKGFCAQHYITPIGSKKSLDQLMAKFTEDVKSFGMEVEFIFKKI